MQPIPLKYELQLVFIFSHYALTQLPLEHEQITFALFLPSWRNLWFEVQVYTFRLGFAFLQCCALAKEGKMLVLLYVIGSCLGEHFNDEAKYAARMWHDV